MTSHGILRCKITKCTSNFCADMRLRVIIKFGKPEIRDLRIQICIK
uniref:Uncharacterized protein n=1 Tax=Arundo donax TaxID=35708 RepID=A0A0A8ZZZ0_ARUDO